MNALREKFPITEEVMRIGRAIAEAGGRPILVGGWVRDCLLGHPHSKDFDIEVFGLPTKTLQSVLSAFGPLHTVGRHFGVLKLTTRAAEYDISVPRRESKIGKGHREFDVVADPHMSFEDAAARRDFTINSIGYEFLADATHDPFSGRDDLERRVLRHTGPAFGEDPLRVLRAMQFAGRFGMTIAQETVRICQAQDLSELPHERIWEEFRKLMLLSERPSRGLQYADTLHVLRYFPEWESAWAVGGIEAGGERFDARQRTLDVADVAAKYRDTIIAPPEAPAAEKQAAEKKAMVLMLAALTHLFGAPGLGTARPLGPAALYGAAQAPLVTFMERLTREHGITDQVWALLRDLPAPDHLRSRAGAGESGPVDAEIRRLALRVSIADLLRLARARHEAAHGDTPRPGAGEPAHAPSAWLADRAQHLGVYGQPPEPFLKGRHLLDLGLRPGPHMGKILDAAFEEQLQGKLASLDDALRWAEPEVRARQAASGGA